MEWPKLTSPSFKNERLGEILKEANPYRKGGHYLYPSDKDGNHLSNFFLIEPVMENAKFHSWVGNDMVLWAKEKKIDFDLVFAPAQPAVKKLASYVSEKLGKRTAFWEYLPTGRFGERLAEGKVQKGDKCIVFNGVTQQGRCVGLRLPGFVESLGGKVVGACVFAKGTTGLVSDLEKRHKDLFYSTIQVDIKVYDPKTCPHCGKEPLRKWEVLLKR